ncbi:hypothetical protein [Streptomyces sp. NPDC001205]
MTFRLKRSAALGAAVLGLGAAAVLGASPASAGTNGQHLTVHTNYADYIQACGHNQNGTYYCTGWIATPNPWTRINGVWWKGDVAVRGVGEHNGRHLDQTVICTVPKSQPSDWTDCYAI